MSSYSQKLKDPRWQAVRLRVMERDGFKCRDCEDNTETLHIHHCHYQKGDPWDTDPKFLITVCEACHSEREREEKRFKELIGLYLAKADWSYTRGAADQLEVALACKEMDYEAWLIIRAWVEDDLVDIRWMEDLRAVTGSDEAYLAVKRRRQQLAANQSKTNETSIP